LADKVQAQQCAIEGSRDAGFPPIAKIQTETLPKVWILIHRSLSDFALHRPAQSIGETASILSSTLAHRLPAGARKISRPRQNRSRSPNAPP
jgi:hypothetical protein